MSLTDYGWCEHFQRLADALELAPDLQPARVVRQERAAWQLRAADGEYMASLAGRMRHETERDHAMRPAVGDWVMCRLSSNTGEAVIHAMLERRSCLVRRAAGNQVSRQVLAANVDTLFIVAGLDANYNVRRLERFLTLGWESGATPVIVLNKADLCEDVEAKLAEVVAMSQEAPVCWTAALEGEGLDSLRAHLGVGKTVAFVGSSGVGKSTLANALLGSEVQAVGEVRRTDGRGRHTTTHRELLLVPGGGVLIDTPGVRELQLWAETEALEQTFAEIETLALSCRFRDCRHAHEPHCAVQAALADGTLDDDRFASYLKQQRELAHMDRTRDPQAQRTQKEHVKAVHRGMRQQNQNPDRKRS